MIDNREKNVTNVLQELYQTITLIGIKKTIDALKYGRDKIKEEEEDNNINKIKNIIIEIFGDECFSFKKEDSNKAARCLLAYNLKKVGVKNGYIANILKIHRNSVCNLVNFIEKSNMINPKSPIEILIKESQDKINKQLN
jgi:hypothetical protein